MTSANPPSTRRRRLPPTAAVTGVAEKAVARLNRSSRMGLGGGTTPFGIPTTTVNAAPGAMLLCENVAVAPLLLLVAHGRLDRTAPLKHAICVMSAGAS